MKQQIKSIEFTERDFQLLVDGLESLPSKDMAGDLMMGLLTNMFVKDEDEKAKMQEERKKEELSKEKAKILLKEEIRILQGKLLQLKRQMISNGLLSKAHEIIE